MYLLVILYIYFVSFLDKPEKSAPALSPRAIEQRAKWQLSRMCRLFGQSARKRH